MQGIHPDTCTHHIYTQENVKHVRKPQKKNEPCFKGYSKRGTS
jgi:hypothetical protein